MAIARRYRRKLVVDGRAFFWCVRDTDADDWYGLTLTVVSEDKRFLVHYRLGQPDGHRYLIVIGPEFPTLPPSGNWRRVLCPEWQRGSGIQPADVRRLIDWCLHSDQAISQVDWRGQPLW